MMHDHMFPNNYLWSLSNGKMVVSISDFLLPFQSERTNRERTKSCRLKRINWFNTDNWHINVLFICPIDKICTCGCPKWDDMIENCFFQKSFGWTFLRQIKLLLFNEFILNFPEGNIPFCTQCKGNISDVFFQWWCTISAYVTSASHACHPRDTFTKLRHADSASQHGLRTCRVV